MSGVTVSSCGTWPTILKRRTRFDHIDDWTIFLRIVSRLSEVVKSNVGRLAIAEIRRLGPNHDGSCIFADIPPSRI